MEKIIYSLVLLAAAAVVIYIPVAGKYFRLLNTLLHEIGHLLASMLSGGGVYHIHLFRDTSGRAYTSSRHRLSMVVTAAAGYPAASAFAFAAYWASVSGHTNWVYGVLIGLLGISLLFWVRNWFGFFWLSAFLAGTAAVYYLAEHKIAQMYILFVAAVLLVESIRSSWIIFYASIVSPHKAGDAQALKKATGLPGRLWGFLFFAQSLYFGVYLPVRLFISHYSLEIFK